MDNAVNNEILLKWQRAAREVFEHEPRELFVSVNGSIKSARKIEKNRTEQSIRIDSAAGEESLEFVEVFSEQNLRLAFISLEEFFAENSGSRNVSVGFSDERMLNLSLNRTGSETKLEIVYFDPYFEEIEALAAEELAARVSGGLLQNKTVLERETPLFGSFLENQAQSTFLGKIKNKLFPNGFGLAPTAAVSLVILIVGALIIGRFLLFAPQVSADEILTRAAASEKVITETLSGTILYRTVDLEEQKPGGEIVSRRKIEIIVDPARNLTVRRLYDEKNQLVAGEWRRTADGVSTLYTRGAMPQLRPAPTDQELANGKAENIWQLSISAAGFKSLVDETAKIKVERRGAEGDYVVSYQTGKNQGVTKAVLLVNEEMRAKEQILTVRREGEDREFRFTETKFEKRPIEMVEKSAFEPERELTGASAAPGVANNLKTEKNESEQIQGNSQQPINGTENGSNTLAAATPELELKVLQLLNGVNALSGEQISITKTPDGRLRISGITDAKSRKDEILNALAEIRGNPALSINIQTAEEAAKNKPVKPDSSAVIENIEIESKTSFPAAETLRIHFSNNGVAEEKIESEVRRYSSTVLAKSSQMRRAALSMKQIAERFSSADLEKMDETARAEWRRLLTQNAKNLLQQSEGLRNELRSVFKIGAGDAGGSLNAGDDKDLARAARRLFDLSLAVDKDVRASFAVSTAAGSNNIAVRSGKFENSLAEIINLARQF